MKKYYSTLFAFIVAFSSFFVSCGENENDLNPAICKVSVMNDGNGFISIYSTCRKCGQSAVTIGGNDSIPITNNIETSVNVLIGDNVEVVATPTDGSTFIGWYVGDSDAPVCTSETFIFTVSENITLIARFTKQPTNGYEWVDLGLSVKWATCNVGAASPEEYGGYYAWGETEEKDNYDWSTYKWCDGSYNTITKYCINSSDGTVDDKTVLDLEDDVAHVKWGGSWRMPTLDELEELRCNCDWEWITQNGVKGYKVTSKTNGNSIFLPAAGRLDGAAAYNRGNSGRYWSSSLYSNDSYGTYFLYFYSSYLHWNNVDYRYCGHSVRPVSE